MIAGTHLETAAMHADSFRNTLSNAIGFWERRRIVYNLVLAAIVIAVFLAGAPRSMNLLSADLAMGLFVLAVLANVAYCAAYPIDVAMQHSDYRATWLRARWVLLAIGIAFASVIAQFVARMLFLA
jgi:hypothetical protein